MLRPPAPRLGGWPERRHRCFPAKVSQKPSLLSKRLACCVLLTLGKSRAAGLGCRAGPWPWAHRAGTCPAGTRGCRREDSVPFCPSGTRCHAGSGEPWVRLVATAGGQRWQGDGFCSRQGSTGVMALGISDCVLWNLRHVPGHTCGQEPSLHGSDTNHTHSGSSAARACL